MLHCQKKICLQRVMLFSFLLKALTKFQMFVTVITEQLLHNIYSVWVVFVLLEYPVDRPSTGTTFMCNLSYGTWELTVTFAVTSTHLPKPVACHKCPVQGLSYTLLAMGEKITNKVIRS
jgi:hypothetical protein